MWTRLVCMCAQARSRCFVFLSKWTKPKWQPTQSTVLAELALTAATAAVAVASAVAPTQRPAPGRRELAVAPTKRDKAKISTRQIHFTTVCGIRVAERVRCVHERVDNILTWLSKISNCQWFNIPSQPTVYISGTAKRSAALTIFNGTIIRKRINNSA